MKAPMDLFGAAYAGDLKRVLSFLGPERDVQARDEYGCTLIHHHLLCGNRKDPIFIQCLLFLGLDPNVQDNFGRTPLRFLTPVDADRKPIAGVLLLNGADPYVKDKDGDSFFSVEKRAYRAEGRRNGYTFLKAFNKHATRSVFGFSRRIDERGLDRLDPPRDYAFEDELALASIKGIRARAAVFLGQHLVQLASSGGDGALEMVLRHVSSCELRRFTSASEAEQGMPEGSRLVKFRYAGEYSGRTEWGEVDAESMEAAIQKLSANGVKVQRLTPDGGQTLQAREAGGRSVGCGSLEFDETHQRFLSKQAAKPQPKMKWWQFWK